MKIQLTEIFSGLQGEGNSQGVNSVFIRFFNCNLTCSTCDSQFTWKNIEKHEVELDDIITDNVSNIIFTGGEPLLHNSFGKNNFKKILEIIKHYPNRTYEIETNGTIPLTDKMKNELYSLTKNIQFNISPKDNFEQDNKKISTEPLLLKSLNDTDKFLIKVLFDCDEDFEYVKMLQEKYNIENKRVWVQPKGIDSKTLKELSLKYYDKIIENGWNLSLRTHIFLFENKKGV